MDKFLKSENHLRNQTDKFLKSENHLRNQTDTFWKSKIHFRNQINKTRIKTYNYLNDTPRTPYESGFVAAHSIRILKDARSSPRYRRRENLAGSRIGSRIGSQKKKTQF